MKATIVQKIFNELTADCNNYTDGVQMHIDFGNSTTSFVICGDTNWNVDLENGILTLEADGTEWIDTDSIIRIHI